MEKNKKNAGAGGTHSALRFVTPDDRHYGREHELLAVKWFQPGISARRRVLGGSWRLKR